MSSSQDTPDLNRLTLVTEKLLEEAKRQGATDAEAAVSSESGLSVSVRLGDVETVEFHCDQGIAVTVYLGQQKGSASSNDLSDEALRETVAAATRIARYASPDSYAGLPDPKTLANQFPDLDLYHPWSIDAEAAAELAIRCEAHALDYHPDLHNSEGASLNSHVGTRVFGNSLGFLAGYPSSRHSMSCSVLGGMGDHMQRDYWYSVARAASDLDTPESIGEKAAQRTIARLNAKSLSTRQCPVLFAPELASGLIGSFINAISGGSLYRKASFLLDSIGKPVFPDFVRLHEQPFLPRALGSASYDAEGVATRTRDIVTDGIVQSYVLGSYSARKLGLRTTGNAGGVHNLTLEPGKLDFNGMLNTLHTGLLVTELMGQGVNRVTGDYSRGASGFWVENGQIQYPVEEITIAGNLKEMYRQIVAIGNDVDLRGNIRTGSILIEQMSIAGQ